MKPSFKLFIGVTLFTTVLFSQNETENKNITDTENQSKQNFNEVKLNALFLVLGAMEISYERTLNEESAIGISGFYEIDDDLGTFNYYISPYYRFYFGKKYAQGFFVEGFVMLNSYDNEDYDYDYYDNDEFFIRTNSEEKINFAIGIGLGGKWVTKSGFIAEISAGIGRNLFNDKNDYYDDFQIVGKGAITLGYRF